MDAEIRSTKGKSLSGASVLSDVATRAVFDPLRGSWGCNFSGDVLTKPVDALARESETDNAADDSVAGEEGGCETMYISRFSSSPSSFDCFWEVSMATPGSRWWSEGVLLKRLSQLSLHGSVKVQEEEIERAV